MDTKDYIRIESALAFLSDRRQSQPTLADVAEHVGLSEHHLQRVFTRWAGISPKRFLQFQTIESAKSLLRDSRSVLDTTYSTGLSSGGRLHDLFVTLEAVTPGEFKSGGAGLTIRTGFHDSPLGECLVGVTELARLDGTAGRVVLGIEVEDRPPAALIRQAMDGARLVGEGDFRRGVARFRNAHSTRVAGVSITRSRPARTTTAASSLTRTFDRPRDGPGGSGSSASG